MEMITRSCSIPYGIISGYDSSMEYGLKRLGALLLEKGADPTTFSHSSIVLGDTLWITLSGFKLK